MIVVKPLPGNPLLYKNLIRCLFILTLPWVSVVYAQQAALVSVDAVVSEQFTQTAPILGRLIAKQTGTVAVRISGPVAETLVEPGDVVAVGQVLARLDTTNLELLKKQAESALVEARTRLRTVKAELVLAGQEVDRLEALKGSAAISQAALDDALQQQKIARSRLNESEAGIRSSQVLFEIAALAYENATIRAPFDGTITEKLTEVGNYLQVGQPVFRLISDRRLELEADIPAAQLKGLSPGFMVRIELENGSQHKATMRAIIPEENPRTRTRRVRFEPILGDGAGDLANEQSVTVYVPVSDVREILTVHKDGIIRRGQANVVYVVVKGAEEPTDSQSEPQPEVVEIRELETGYSIGNRVEVMTGLSAGERVVIRGNERLRPGQAVRIAGSQ